LDDDLTQFVQNNDKSLGIIDLTKDMNNPSVIIEVVDQLLDPKTNVTHAVQVINVYFKSILLFHTAFSNVFFYFYVWNQCLVWDLLVKSAYEVASLLPVEIQSAVQATSRILLSPFMETTITNYMKKKCDKDGTLYVMPQQTSEYHTTARATPRILLRAGDNKILEDPDVASLDLGAWGSEVIKGDFAPEPGFPVIEVPTTTQDQQNGRGMRQFLFKK